MRRFFFALVLMAASNALEAKGTTVKLTLSGPRLPARIEIVEPAILNGSNVWEGSFIGDTLAAAPPVKPRIYTLAFGGPARCGCIYPGEPGYPLNVGTILRDTQDGRWHRPSAAWATAVAKYVP